MPVSPEDAPDHTFPDPLPPVSVAWRDRWPDWALTRRAREARAARWAAEEAAIQAQWERVQTQWVAHGRQLEQAVDRLIRQHPEWQTFRD